MKTNRTFKGSWFLTAMVVAIVVGELIAWNGSSAWGFRFSPIPIAFLCIGLVEAGAVMLYRNAELG